MITIPKPPVVVFLGHIDSGKTSLLNAIRGLPFSEEKPGGKITQEIFAFQIEKNQKKITFIDTPGHEAFSKMRSRGAKVADIAVLVIDGVEGIKQQTKEAISHIKEAKIPFIVAINKVDKLQANPQKIKLELKKEGILVEELGGKIPCVEVSAKARAGVEDLLELILIIAEIEKLETTILSPAEGIIIESFLDPKRGPLAHVILEKGKLKPGDFVASFSTFGKVKKIESFEKKPIFALEPAFPAFLLGFQKVPEVGEKFFSFSSLSEAQNFVKKTKQKEKVFFVEEREEKILPIVLKAESLGSLEACLEILKTIPQEKIKLKILEKKVGEISENDIELAKIARGIIVGFKVNASAFIKELAQKNKVKILTTEIIYELVEMIKKEIERRVAPEKIKIKIGKAKVLVDFWREKNRQIVGARIIEGEIEKSTFLEIEREGKVLGQVKVINIQINKKDVQKGKKGDEVGILVEGDTKIEKGDILTILKEIQDFNATKNN